ncbi:MAG: FHA domain-containing protein [Gemmatimonadetes bacterium]|nr:FHA domain-containing protein [Gemmatimonadota bacterium]MBK9068681.1 FHA domain-containing protein [Gemmatimonadota bacterium]
MSPCPFRGYLVAMGIMERLSGAFGPRVAERPLELVRGPKRWPLGHRPLAIGRAPESDIVIPGEQVSRLHAWIVPAAEGAFVVDQSRLGTLVNGERIVAPRPLTPGDEIQIGEIRYQVALASAPVAGAAPPGGAGRVAQWLRRYGPSEVLGTVASVGAAVGVQEFTGSLAAAAYAGALTETVVFYGVMFLRESVREAHQAGIRGRPFGSADLLPVARSLLLEFGAAESLDLLLVRPACMALGLQMIGGNLGGLVGKLAADLVFYGPVLAIYEWRLARTRARDGQDHRRRTTAVGLARIEDLGE